MKDLSRWILPALTGLAIVGLWYMAHHVLLGERQRTFLPELHAIAGEWWSERGTILERSAITMRGALIGFAFAVCAGGALAIFLGLNRHIKDAFFPWVLVLQMIPAVVLIPIFRLWLGAGIGVIIAITFMISFFSIVANTVMGLVSTDKGLIDLFRMYGANKRQEIFLLRLPYALPYFLTGLKIAGTLAPIGAITGDLLAGSRASDAGLGYLVAIWANRANYEGVFAVAFTAAAIGFIFVGFVNFLHWFFLHNWHDSAVRTEH